MSDVKVEHGWAERLIGYYREGYSDTEVAAALNITKREFNQMLADNPTFSKLVEFGRTLSNAYWEALARKNVLTKGFNTPLYNFYMKNKFGWADKIETNNINENNNLSADELKAQIANKLAKLSQDGNIELITDAKMVLDPVDEKEANE